MRRAVLECGANAVEKQKRDSPDLAKIEFIVSRIENVSHTRLCDVTVFYCFDLTFECNATAYLHMLACDLRKLRLVVVAKHPCPRHSGRCKNRFCRMWRLQQTVYVEVSYSKNLLPMYIFEKESLSSLCVNELDKKNTILVQTSFMKQHPTITTRLGCKFSVRPHTMPYLATRQPIV